MENFTTWLQGFMDEVKRVFGSRVLFIGLQGSYGRNEATADSDIDLVVILDELQYEDLQEYDDMLARLACDVQLCGFLSGKDELKCWNRADLFQFYHDTTPLVGSLENLLPEIGPDDVKQAILIGVCNLYHMSVHNSLYEKDTGILKALYKSAVFVLQAVEYDRSGTYYRDKTELMAVISKGERKILQDGIHLKTQATEDQQEFARLSRQIFLWAQTLIHAYGQSLPDL